MTRNLLRSDIKAKLKANKTTAKELCEHIGISRYNLSAFLNSRQSLTYGTFKKLYKGFKKLPPEHNLKGMENIEITILIDLYKNKGELEKLFKVFEEIEKT